MDFKWKSTLASCLLFFSNSADEMRWDNDNVSLVRMSVCVREGLKKSFVSEASTLNCTYVQVYVAWKRSPPSNATPTLVAKRYSYCNYFPFIFLNAQSQNMRRRQHEDPKMTEPNTNQIDQEDPDGRYFGAEKVEDTRPLLAAFGIPSFRPRADSNPKAFSVMPRNYNTRRRVLIAGGCFILALVLFLASNHNGKAIEKSSFIFLSSFLLRCSFWLSDAFLVSFRVWIGSVFYWSEKYQLWRNRQQVTLQPWLDNNNNR